MFATEGQSKCMRVTMWRYSYRNTNWTREEQEGQNETDNAANYTAERFKPMSRSLTTKRVIKGQVGRNRQETKVKMEQKEWAGQTKGSI